MRRYILDLVAGKEESIPVVGNYLRIIAGNTEIEVTPDTGQQLQGLQSGMSWTASKQFNSLRVSSKTSQRVEIMAGYGEIDDNRTSISGVVSVSMAEPTIISSGTRIKTSRLTMPWVPDINVNRSAVIPAAVGRVSVIIQNDTDASDAYVSGGFVSAQDIVDTGIKLRAFESVTIDRAAESEISVYSGAGGPVRVLEEFIQ